MGSFPTSSDNGYIRVRVSLRLVQSERSVIFPSNSPRRKIIVRPIRFHLLFLVLSMTFSSWSSLMTFLLETFIFQYRRRNDTHTHTRARTHLHFVINREQFLVVTQARIRDEVLEDQSSSASGNRVLGE